MSDSTASAVVLATGGVLTVLALLTKPGDASGGGGSRYKAIWAAGLLTLALGLASDVLPELTGWFAASVILAAVLKNPGVVGSFINKGGPGAATATTSTTGG